MRVLAIGDIHGCLAPLNQLLDWVKPTGDDLLVTLGDYVDRGPDSKGVLDRLIELKRHLNLVCLRGNHEQMMVDGVLGGRADLKMWLGVGGVETLASYGIAPGRDETLDAIPRGHWDFLHDDLADYHETEHFIFAHATVLPDHDMPDQPDYALLWEFLPDAMRHHSGKTVICGHTNQKSGVPKVIPGAACIDTTAYKNGWLTCLDAISGRYWQADLQGRTREGRLDYEE
jgi:serine/threonine protein phosphatase 1